MSTSSTARGNSKQTDLYNGVGETLIFIIVYHLYANMSMGLVDNNVHNASSLSESDLKKLAFLKNTCSILCSNP